VAYRIAFSREVRRQIADLPGYVRSVAKQEIADLSDDPRPDRSKELTGYPDYFRLWLGPDYRLVWHVLDDEQMVEVEYVGPKTPNLYEYLGLARPQLD
jgi:mRNA-degrading endonuclease RelE of RelBE toxin-antitoxin system